MLIWSIVAHLYALRIYIIIGAHTYLIFLLISRLNAPSQFYRVHITIKKITIKIIFIYIYTHSSFLGSCFRYPHFLQTNMCLVRLRCTRSLCNSSTSNPESSIKCSMGLSSTNTILRPGISTR